MGVDAVVSLEAGKYADSVTVAGFRSKLRSGLQPA